MSFNQIQIVGNLGRDPEIKQTDKTKIATFSVATNKRTKDGDKTVWFRIIAFGQLAELAETYFVKGSSIFVSGELSIDEWRDVKKGKDGTTLEVRADKINFLPRGLDASRDADDSTIGMKREGFSNVNSFDSEIPFALIFAFIGVSFYLSIFGQIIS